MEKEILSKINDLKNLIETTIKTFDDFSYNKTYIINSLTQIEDWIKNYNNIINNDLKKNIKTEETKKIENIITNIKDNSILKNTNEINKTSYDITIKNILNNNKVNSNTPNNNSNNTYDNEFNSIINLKIIKEINL